MDKERIFVWKVEGEERRGTEGGDFYGGSFYCEDKLGVFIRSKDKTFRMIIHVSRFREIVRCFWIRVDTEAQDIRGGIKKKKNKKSGKKKQKGKPTSRSLNG